MPQNDDEKALELIETAVYKAQVILADKNAFNPFLMLLNEAGEQEFFESDLENEDESYAWLENSLEERLKEGAIEVMVLLREAGVPSKFNSLIKQSIRVHLEEKSQIEEKIGGRFLYIPYERIKNPNETLSVILHAPLLVGFPAQYIIK